MFSKAEVKRWCLRLVEQGRVRKLPRPVRLCAAGLAELRAGHVADGLFLPDRPLGSIGAKVALASQLGLIQRTAPITPWASGFRPARLHRSWAA